MTNEDDDGDVGTVPYHILREENLRLKQELRDRRAKEQQFKDGFTMARDALRDTVSKSRAGRFDFLKNRKIVSDAELLATRSKWRRDHLDIDTYVMQRHGLTAIQILTSLSDYHNKDVQRFDSALQPPAELLRGLDVKELRQEQWIPLFETGGKVVVLIDDPSDNWMTDRITARLSPRTVDFNIGLRADIEAYIAAAVARGDLRDTPVPSTDLETSIEALIKEISAEEINYLEEQKEGEEPRVDSKVQLLAHRLLESAFAQGASDIHIEPYRELTEVRFRVDGICRHSITVPPAQTRALVQVFRIMARMRIDKAAEPLNGRLTYRIGERDVDFRVVLIPTTNVHNDMVLRVAVSDHLPMEALNLSGRNRREIDAIVQRPFGLFLTVGPTGSGKTTTLHSILASINDDRRKIWTVEDPVEITQHRLRQVDVSKQLSFDSALRAFLRADPDVMMVGEIRDPETARTAIEAALTGHFVFSTLHTNGAVETIVRLRNMRLDMFDVSDALSGVLAQRLVRKLCDCKRIDSASEDELAIIGKVLGVHSPVVEGRATPLHRAREGGCMNCRDGYRGRVPIHEMLVINEEIKRLIQMNASSKDLADAAARGGMTTLLQDGYVKALEGSTDLYQVALATVMQ